MTSTGGKGPLFGELTVDTRAGILARQRYGESARVRYRAEGGRTQWWVGTVEGGRGQILAASSLEALIYKLEGDLEASPMMETKQETTVSPGSKWVTSNELAERYGLTPGAFTRANAAGELAAEPGAYPRAAKRFKLADVKAWMEKIRTENPYRWAKMQHAMGAHKASKPKSRKAVPVRRAQAGKIFFGTHIPAGLHKRVFAIKAQAAVFGVDLTIETIAEKALTLYLESVEKARQHAEHE